MRKGKFFCFHNYKPKAKKSNFYGEVELFECKKCEKQKCKVVGYPDMGIPSKTTYEHYE
tara:strand:- start:229 stop:405 length:177 start_codon:yes stop_codon:yes gene_type:complete